MRRTPDIDEPSSVPPHEGAPELFEIPPALAHSHPGGLDDLRQAAEYGEFTGGIDDFASEASVDGVNRIPAPAATTQASWTDEAVPDELLPTADSINADEPRVPEIPLPAEDEPSEEHALDAFRSESSRGPAPWRSPDEILSKAPARRADLSEPVDDPLNPSDDTAVPWDTAPVYPPSHADMSATDSKMSVVTTPVPPSGLRWLGMVAVTFLLFAIGVSLLPPDGLGVPAAVTPEPATSGPAKPSLDPASSGPIEKVTGTAGMVPGPVDPRATPESPPSTKPSAAANSLGARDNTPSIPGSLSAADWLAREGRPSAVPVPSSSRPTPTSPAGSSAGDRLAPQENPVVITAAPRRETALASAAARNNRADTTDVVPSPAAAAPRRNSPATPPPPPPAADTVARTDVPSTPVDLSRETTERPLPPTAAGEPTARAVSPAAPAIPPDVTVDRAGTAGEAAAIDGITATLRRLQLAYEQRDATLAKAVWPTVNERALARAFDGLRSQSVTFDSCWMNVFSVSADVECRGVTTYVPRVGGQYQRTESRQWTFRVEKGDDRWLITSAEAR